MVDVTGKFYSYIGFLDNPKDSISWSAFDRLADSLFQRLERPSMSDIYSVQEEIDLLSGGAPNSNISTVLSAHQQGVVQILYEKLRSSLEETQLRDMAQVDRDLSLQKHFLPKKLVLGKTKHFSKPVRPDYQTGGASSSSLEHEGEVLLATYLADQDNMTEVRRKVQETSVLLSLLSAKVTEQHDVALSVLDVAQESVVHVEQADSHLTKAIKNNQGYKFYIVSWFVLVSCILIMLDWIKG